MRLEDDTRICVQREWNGWRTAEVRLRDLQQVHWLQPSGAPRPLVHGYVSCDGFITGSLVHECAPEQRPHPLLVCVLKSHTVPAVYDELVRRANGRRCAMDLRAWA
jgi:hypothetical protein